jgi:hypothetical protein
MVLLRKRREDQSKSRVLGVLLEERRRHHVQDPLLNSSTHVKVLHRLLLCCIQSLPNLLVPIREIHNLCVSFSRTLRSKGCAESSRTVLHNDSDHRGWANTYPYCSNPNHPLIQAYIGLVPNSRFPSVYCWVSQRWLGHKSASSMTTRAYNSMPTWFRSFVLGILVTTRDVILSGRVYDS